MGITATNIGQNLGSCVAYYYYFRVGVGDNTNDGGWARMLTLTRMGFPALGIELQGYPYRSLIHLGLLSLTPILEPELQCWE